MECSFSNLFFFFFFNVGESSKFTALEKAIRFHTTVVAYHSRQ